MQGAPGGLPRPLPGNIIPVFQQAALRNWQGLEADLAGIAGYHPGIAGTFWSSWRFLVRLLLTPVGLINDHVDYKAILRGHAERGG